MLFKKIDSKAKITVPPIFIRFLLVLIFSPNAIIILLLFKKIYLTELADPLSGRKDYPASLGGPMAVPSRSPVGPEGGSRLPFSSE